MNQAPIISVCIANYNGMGVIDECLESVLNQSGGLAVEVIIHDDASSDGSVTHIQRNHPDAILIESEENVGFCVANNRMANAASGKYLLFLNNDAALLNDSLMVLLAAAEHHNNMSILGLPQFDADTNELIDNGSLLDPFLNPFPNTWLTNMSVGMIMGSCLWIPKDLWDILGGFPEWFGSIGEDLYLCCRARLAGYEVRALGKSGYRHKVGTSFGGGKISRGKLSTTLKRRSLSERNKTYVICACYPTAALALVLPLHLLLLILEGLSLNILKWNIDIFRSIYAPVLTSLWRERVRLIDLRSKCQGARNCTFSSWLSAFRPFPYKLRMLIKHGLPQITSKP